MTDRWSVDVVFMGGKVTPMVNSCFTEMHRFNDTINITKSILPTLLCQSRSYSQWCWLAFNCVQISLRWRHDECDGVSNHQPHDWLLYHIQAQIKRKHQGSASLAFVRGINWWPVNSLHKWPVTRKRFPFDDVIMFGQFVTTFWVSRGRGFPSSNRFKKVGKWGSPVFRITWQKCVRLVVFDCP